MKNNIQIITYYDDEYPPQLRQIKDPPAALFVKGNFPEMANQPVVSMIGTRTCTEFGEKLAAGLAYELAQADFVVVSGMAMGIDAYSHKGALLAKGKTVAVLASGVDKPTPYCNKPIYDRIISSGNGAVISEFLPGTDIKQFAYHQRNRIVSALSQAVLVVESGFGGGSMITVDHALAQGRPVLAIPGAPGSPASYGTNELIRTGALLCRGSLDIIEEFERLLSKSLPRPARKANIPDTDPLAKLEPRKQKKAPSKKEKAEPLQKEIPVGEAPKKQSLSVRELLTDEEQTVVDALADGALAADTVCDILGISFPMAVSVLNSLELKGYAEALPGGQYKLID